MTDRSASWIFAGRKKGVGQDCAFCRNSRVDPKKGRFMCLLSYRQMDASTCPDFKDSRKPRE
jgi:hypothetical protein